MRTRNTIHTLIAISLVATATVAAADSSGQWLGGQEAYEKVCGYCHERGIGPVIRGQDKLPELVHLMVRSGSGAMPAFRRTEIDDKTLAAIIAYIK